MKAVVSSRKIWRAKRRKQIGVQKKDSFETDLTQNLESYMAWASDFAPLLVIWSPWVNGFTVSSSLCSGPSLHLLSLRTCQFLFLIFPHFSQDNAWDYDPAAQVWGCRDSGGCSYYCHWGGSGKAPHLSGNASSDSTNTSPPSPIFPPVFSLALLHNHSRGAFSHRGLKSISAPVFLRTPICK